MCHVETKQHWLMQAEQIIHLMDGTHQQSDEQKYDEHDEVINHQVM
jgi:hypothetical protein